jgi:hypothetical protein
MRGSYDIRQMGVTSGRCICVRTQRQLFDSISSAESQAAQIQGWGSTFTPGRSSVHHACRPDDYWPPAASGSQGIPSDSRLLPKSRCLRAERQQHIAMVLAIPGGLEPPARRLEGGCSIQLSYGTVAPYVRQVALSRKRACHENRIRIVPIIGKGRADREASLFIQRAGRNKSRLDAGFQR